MGNAKTECLNGIRFFAICIIAFGWHYQHFGVDLCSPISSFLYGAFPMVD